MDKLGGGHGGGGYGSGGYGGGGYGGGKASSSSPLGQSKSQPKGHKKENDTLWAAYAKVGDEYLKEEATKELIEAHSKRKESERSQIARTLGILTSTGNEKHISDYTEALMKVKQLSTINALRVNNPYTGHEPELKTLMAYLSNNNISPEAAAAKAAAAAQPEEEAKAPYPLYRPTGYGSGAGAAAAAQPEEEDLYPFYPQWKQNNR